MHPVPLPFAFVSFFTSIFGAFSALPTDPDRHGDLFANAACMSVDEKSDKGMVLDHKCIYTCRAGSLR